MKVKTLSLLAGGGSLLLAGTANAALVVTADFAHGQVVATQIIDFTGHPSGQGANLQLEYLASGLWVWDISIVFDSSAHTVHAVGAVGDDFILTGPIFTTNPPGESNWYAPATFAVFDPAYGTYLGLTPGAAAAFDSWITFPGNNTPLRYGTWNDGSIPFFGAHTTDDGGMSSDNPGVVGLGGGQVFQISYDNLGSAFLQFQFAYGLDGNVATDEIANVQLSLPAIPAPGALALLGLAGLVGVRRRRD